MTSAIICTYNREKYIIDCLEHLRLAIPEEVEVLIVDNNSTDGTAELVKNYLGDHPDFPGRYLLETRQGLSHARNRGIAEARGDTLVFLDDDSMVAEDYFERLREGLDEYPQAGAFGGHITPVFEDGITPRWLCRWTLSWVSGLDMGALAKPFPKNKYPIGANMAFRRSVIERTGMFNPELGRSGKNLMGGEEKDLFQRIKAAGHSIIYLPKLRIEHMIPPSRTTLDYIRRFGEGVGRSERIRSKAEGTYKRRLLSEAVKWCDTLFLLVGYTLIGRPSCGATLVLFRWHVTRNLLREAR